MSAKKNLSQVPPTIRLFTPTASEHFLPFLEQDIFTRQNVLVIPRKQWLPPNMTEKLLNGMLSIKPNQKLFTFYRRKVEIGQPGELLPSYGVFKPLSNNCTASRLIFYVKASNIETLQHHLTFPSLEKTYIKEAAKLQVTKPPKFLNL